MAKCCSLYTRPSRPYISPLGSSHPLPLKSKAHVQRPKYFCVVTRSEATKAFKAEIVNSLLQAPVLKQTRMASRDMHTFPLVKSRTWEASNISCTIQRRLEYGFLNSFSRDFFVPVRLSSFANSRHRLSSSHNHVMVQQDWL